MGIRENIYGFYELSSVQTLWWCASSVWWLYVYVYGLKCIDGLIFASSMKYIRCPAIRQSWDCICMQGSKAMPRTIPIYVYTYVYTYIYEVILLMFDNILWQPSSLCDVTHTHTKNIHTQHSVPSSTLSVPGCLLEKRYTSKYRAYICSRTICGAPS